jgi:type IV secretion system protein VirB1
MPGLVLTTAAVTALAATCAAGSGVPVERLRAVAIHESGLKPYAIGVNADPARGLPAATISPATPAEAVAQATALLAQGRRIDLGLMQVSDRQLRGLSIAEAFDPCRNIAAGAAHLKADFDWVLAHRRYNCGRTDCGVQYATAVEQIATGVASRTPEGADAPPPPKQQVDPQPPAWDMEAVANWRRRHFPTPEDVALAPAVSDPSSKDKQ